MVFFGGYTSIFRHMYIFRTHEVISKSLRGMENLKGTKTIWKKDKQKHIIQKFRCSDFFRTDNPQRG